MSVTVSFCSAFLSCSARLSSQDLVACPRSAVHGSVLDRRADRSSTLVRALVLHFVLLFVVYLLFSASSRWLSFFSPSNHWAFCRSVSFFAFQHNAAVLPFSFLGQTAWNTAVFSREALSSSFRQGGTRNSVFGYLGSTMKGLPDRFANSLN